jgi:hypothetical protein
MRSSEPQVVGEALMDDARTATPTRGVAEGATTSPPVVLPCTLLRVLRPQLGGVGGMTSPIVVDVDPIRAVP